MNIDDETFNEDVLECPYCGYLHNDMWEIAGHDEDGEIDCHNCDKEIMWLKYVSVSYTGRKKK